MACPAYRQRAPAHWQRAPPTGAHPGPHLPVPPVPAWPAALPGPAYRWAGSGSG